ncbi:MAG: LytR C-terminal domain-containing protein [Brachybacterium sp.]|uniref:LytR C-terminal domain-containing protein n=1 Tax=Brachybacterium sp. TaxID=1891286 RepID=UPI00264CF6DB|nr:LytR C-terminal domain-containing protein [Brachybacterium sp.]MDN6302480.1 LytR C-terminal domain-containing protein [Brachybacterium sp.]MDN6329205.1 LytR C-terminal domain-containing protein [Brachybacterium sp.]MDN6399648.1 LytR C-terminal domain-containing protein [Brachybacterium sp.]
MSSSHQDAHPYGRSADDVRRRDQRLRRTRRLRATQLTIFSILAVALIAIGVYAVGELREPVADPGVIAQKSFGPEVAELTCPEPDAVPLPPGEVTVTVLNGTSRSGLAGDVSEQLAERGYGLESPGNTRQAAGPATIVHGPEGYLAAQSVRVQIQGAQLRLDEQQEGSAVQVLIGDGFTGLEEESAAASALEKPVDPPEGC